MKSIMQSCFQSQTWSHAFASSMSLMDVCALQVAAEDASEVQRLEKEIAAVEKEQLPLQKKLAPLQLKVEALEGKIENAGGAPLRKQKEAVSGLQEVSRVYLSRTPCECV